MHQQPGRSRTLSALTCIFISMAGLSSGCQSPGAPHAISIPSAPVSGTSSNPQVSPRSNTSISPTEEPGTQAATGGSLKWRDVKSDQGKKASMRCQSWLGEPNALADTFKSAKSGGYRWIGGAGEGAGHWLFVCILSHSGEDLFGVRLYEVAPDFPSCDAYGAAIASTCLEDDDFEMQWDSLMKPASDRAALTALMNAAFQRIER